MVEREPRKEIIERGEIYYLWHPTATDVFSGYGLTMKSGSKEFLVGLLMVDRPTPADPEWLKEVEATFGECQLITIAAGGERGIACQMQIAAESLPYLRRFPGEKTVAIQAALEPLLENPPKPAFTLRWNEETQLWHSVLAPLGELPEEIREVFETTGYGCLAAETNIGVVHVCHAANGDIEGFANKPVLYQWQLIKIPKGYYTIIQTIFGIGNHHPSASPTLRPASRDCAYPPWS